MRISRCPEQQAVETDAGGKAWWRDFAGSKKLGRRRDGTTGSKVEGVAGQSALRLQVLGEGMGREEGRKSNLLLKSTGIDRQID